MFILIVVAAWILTPSIYVQQPLIPYVDIVYALVHDNCKENQYLQPNNITINIGKLPAGILGECGINDVSYEIVIDKDFWANSDTSQKFQVIAHEMTHCVFQEEHSPDENNYMYSEMSDIKITEVFRQLMEMIHKHCPTDY